MALPRDIAGRRYAIAIAELASERGESAQWDEAVDALDALTSSAAFVAALQSEQTSDDRLQSIVREAAPGIGQSQLNLFRLLRRKGRLVLGSSIASYYRELRDEEREIVRAEVRTAVALDDERRQAIVNRIREWTGKQVEIEAEIGRASCRERV